MKNEIKKWLALALIGLFTVGASGIAQVKPFSTDESVQISASATTQFWVYRGTGFDPTLPSSYRPPMTGDEPCIGSAELCGINAPEGTPGQPQISPELEDKITHLDTEGDEVVLKN